MKIMQIGWADLCGYGDWLTSSASMRFAEGGYTHVEFQGDIIKSELFYAEDGSPLVGFSKVLA